MDQDFESVPLEAPRTSGMAIGSLILGISSFMCWIFAGIPAIILGALALGEINKSRGRVTGSGMAITGIVTGSISTLLIVPAIVLALLLPAIQAAREAARRNQSMSNMKQIDLALLNHESAKRVFPAPGGGPAGKSQLSWRVHILPYLDDQPSNQQLYAQFHLDEPWDSPHNRTLIDKMPEIFANPTGRNIPPGRTTYLLATGRGTTFPDGDATPAARNITDGMSNTILLVETDPELAVEWTKPDDWHLTPNDPLAGLGHLRFGGFLAGFADGRVQFIRDDIGPSTFQALLSPAGNDQ